MGQEAKPGSPDPEDGCSDAMKQSGTGWKRSPAVSPALEGGIRLSLAAAADPSADVALGRIAAPRAGMLSHTSDCGSYGERR